jgi:hypothetical protein
MFNSSEFLRRKQVKSSNFRSGATEKRGSAFTVVACLDLLQKNLILLPGIIFRARLRAFPE